MDQFSRDASKPDGHHSRCTPCKIAGKRRAPATLLFLVPAPKPPKAKPTPPPAPPRTVDVAAALRRDALVELVRRHRREFDDICAVMRQERTPENPTRQWRSATNLASVASQ